MDNVLRVIDATDSLALLSTDSALLVTPRWPAFDSVGIVVVNSWIIGSAEETTKDR